MRSRNLASNVSLAKSCSRKLGVCSPASPACEAVWACAVGGGVYERPLPPEPVTVGPVDPLAALSMLAAPPAVAAATPAVPPVALAPASVAAWRSLVAVRLSDWTDCSLLELDCPPAQAGRCWRAVSHSWEPAA
ncbi:MAG TPA: hypothetical protein VME22_14340 [Solirubrobacteraceae bacterium]|nr:hypothetical protein [Solirubrobacteraceae bacterium]